MSAEFKLTAALVIVLATALMPLTSVTCFVVVALILAIGAIAAKVSLRTFLKRFLVAEPFVFGVALLAWLQPGGGWIFVGLVVKSTLCVVAMVLLAATTPFSELLGVLRRFRMPALLVTTLALLDRYRTVLAEETLRMRRARASRTFPGRKRGFVWRTLANVMAVLFVRSTERAERIYAAMCARGWK